MQNFALQSGRKWHCAEAAQPPIQPRRFASRAYVGAGLGLWDLTHTDFLTPTALVHFGLPLWKGDDQRTLFFVTEGRVFLRRASDIDSNYQFWGGLRFLFR